MVQLEELARAALVGQSLLLRSLAQEWLRETAELRSVPMSVVSEEEVLAAAAGLAELFAFRRGEPPPPWTASVGPAARDTFLLKEAQTMKRLRTLCLEQSPLPLRRRRFYAPPNYLEAV